MDLLTTKQAAALIAAAIGKPYSYQRVIYLINQGKINATMVGKSYVLTPADVESYLAKRAAAASIWTEGANRTAC